MDVHIFDKITITAETEHRDQIQFELICEKMRKSANQLSEDGASNAKIHDQTDDTNGNEEDAGNNDIDHSNNTIVLTRGIIREYGYIYIEIL